MINYHESSVLSHLVQFHWLLTSCQWSFMYLYAMRRMIGVLMMPSDCLWVIKKFLSMSYRLYAMILIKFSVLNPYLSLNTFTWLDVLTMRESIFSTGVLKSSLFQYTIQLRINLKERILKKKWVKKRKIQGKTDLSKVKYLELLNFHWTNVYIYSAVDF